MVPCYISFQNITRIIWETKFKALTEIRGVRP